MFLFNQCMKLGLKKHKLFYQNTNHDILINKNVIISTFEYLQGVFQLQGVFLKHNIILFISLYFLLTIQKKANKWRCPLH